MREKAQPGGWHVGHTGNARNCVDGRNSGNGPEPLCPLSGVQAPIGTSADNALAESFNASMKREVLQDSKTFTNQLVCRREVFRWCTRYNTVRRHSWCNHLAPNVFERHNEATLKRAS